MIKNNAEALSFFLNHLSHAKGTALFLRQAVIIGKIIRDAKGTALFFR